MFKNVPDVYQSGMDETAPSTRAAQRNAAFRNAAAFLAFPGFTAFLIAAWVAAYPPDFAHPSQAAALKLSVLVPVILLGAIGTYLSIYSGMTPDPLRARGNRQGLTAAVLSGVVLGLTAVSLDAATGFSDLIARRLQVDSIHIEFPASAFVYVAGAIVVECLYRLIPIGTLYFLIAHLAFRRRHGDFVFWFLAALTSLIEPLSQAGLAEGQVLVWALFAVIFVFNLVEAMLWRRYGWIALILSRVTFYFIWHVALGPAL